MRLEQKQQVVERLTEQIRGSTAMIVANYRGLSVTQVAEVRRSLNETGATFHVAKNTLAKIAATNADRSDLIELLQGPTAIAFVGDDPAAVAKKLSDIARTTRILEVRGAVMEGQTLSAAEVRQLGDLPPKDVLRAQVVGAIAGPLQGGYNVLAAPLREFLVVLDQYISKRQAAEAA